MLGVGNGLDGQICSMIPCEKTPSRAAIWRPLVLGKNGHRDIHCSPGLRNDVLAPSSVSRAGRCRNKAANQSDEQIVGTHLFLSTQRMLVELTSFMKLLAMLEVKRPAEAGRPLI